MTQLTVGAVVKVHCYGGEILMRRVVRDLGKTVVICNESEYRNAVQEHREADDIGFPRSAVELVYTGVQVVKTQ